MIICLNQVCNTGVQNPFQHVINRHRYLLQSAQKEMVKERLDAFIRHDAPQVTGTIHKIKGLRVLEGFTCTVCSFVAASANTIRQHKSVMHQENERLLEVTPINVQRFWSGSSYFPVYNTNHTADNNSFLHMAAQVTVKIIADPTHSIDERYISIYVLLDFICISPSNTSSFKHLLIRTKDP